MSNRAPDAYLDALRQQVEGALDEILPPRDHVHPDHLALREAMRYATLGGGKRIRPCLTLAVCEAVGGSIADALGVACAVELVHCYSLVHDDLPAMDDDDLRRGAPTCHRQFGEANAVLVGDALLTLAFQVMADEARRKADRPLPLVEAAGALARAAGHRGMVGGQAFDMSIKQDSPPFETLEACHALKTAALFGAAAEIGALVGGGSAEVVDTARRYGEQLGLAFQHADDLRDAENDEHRDQARLRVDELTASAMTLARRLGDSGPLAGLAELVKHRAS